MIITAEIAGIKYTPKLTRKLEKFELSRLPQALASVASFQLQVGTGEVLALSWWVSAKRTRSYPYARVYDTLSFNERKVTVIPIFKDEGKEGDRDFLQWDTVSLMSLLGVNVIISYYDSASRSGSYSGKITNQRFAIGQLEAQLKDLVQSPLDPLQWNLAQADKAGTLATQALSAYDQISRRLGVKMHSVKSANSRISKLVQGREVFKTLSRRLAESAQSRETVTVQPKERLSGKKASITIRDQIGGQYFFTVDEARKEDGKVLLIEGKHSKGNHLPSLEDIKDALLKLMIYANLRKVWVDGARLLPVPILLLTTGPAFSSSRLASNEQFLLLKQEAAANHFRIFLNDKSVDLED